MQVIDTTSQQESTNTLDEPQQMSVVAEKEEDKPLGEFLHVVDEYLDFYKQFIPKDNFEEKSLVNVNVASLGKYQKVLVSLKQNTVPSRSKVTKIMELAEKYRK